MNICPPGIRGEICVAGLGIGKGYWNDPVKTGKAFIDNPFQREANNGYTTLYKTGDIGYYTSSGEIICLGRVDDQVKVRGLRIELGEIESRLLTHELIEEATLLPVKKNGDTHLIAYYQANEEIPVADLKSFLAQSLPDYMVPAGYVFMHAMPVTHNGKLNKKALPEYKFKSSTAITRPPNSVEADLIDIWVDILGIDKSMINTESNFFDLGGHSLKAITLSNKIHKKFSTEIPLKEIFKKETVENIADYLITVKQIQCETEFVNDSIEVSL